MDTRYAPEALDLFARFAQQHEGPNPGSLGFVTLRLYSDGSGSIWFAEERLLEFESLGDLTNQLVIRLANEEARDGL